STSRASSAPARPACWSTRCPRHTSDGDPSSPLHVRAAPPPTTGAPPKGWCKTPATSKRRTDHALQRSERQNMTTTSFLDVLEEIIEKVVEPGAAQIDTTGAF